MSFFKKLVRPMVSNTKAGAGLLKGNEDSQTAPADVPTDELFSTVGDMACRIGRPQGMTGKIRRIFFTMCPLHMVAPCRWASLDPGIFQRLCIEAEFDSKTIVDPLRAPVRYQKREKLNTQCERLTLDISNTGPDARFE
jgi:hypothetical protein